MPAVPPPGSVTVCESNRELIVCESLSDEQARESYGKVLGVVFSPVSFRPDLATVAADTDNRGEQDRIDAPKKGLPALFQQILRDSFKHFFNPNHISLLPEVNLQGVSWHQHKHLLAFVSGPDQVTIRDYEDLEGTDPCILANECQRDITVLGWRPNGVKTLSVACKGGICIWSASCPGNLASVRSGRTSYLGPLSRGGGSLAMPSRATGVQWNLVDYLQSHNDEHISAMSWSPNGCYLASGSYESSSFTIWDVAQGVGTPIRRGLAGISVLKWSPTGDYFFAAKFDGTFYLWETNTWTSEPWYSTSGFVTGVAWDPDGRVIVIAFSKSSTLGSIHFASKPPSLDAHLLPFDFPEITSSTGSEKIDKMAWDASGERLALSYKGGDELYKGLIALYDVRRTPLISASLIGFIRGPGDDPKPLTFSFHNKFKQGPLLTVSWSSGFCCTYPLLFRPHLLS